MLIVEIEFKRTESGISPVGQIERCAETATHLTLRNLNIRRTIRPKVRLLIHGRLMCSTAMSWRRERRSAPNNSGRSQFKTIKSGFQDLITLFNFQIAEVVSAKVPLHFRSTGKTSQDGITSSCGPALIGTNAIGHPRLTSSLQTRFIDLSAPPPVRELVSIITRFTEKS